MNLDITTLTVATGFVALMASVLLAGAWKQIPRAPALAWWSAASLLDATGIFVIAVGTDEHRATATAAGVACFTLCPAIVWAGVRIFTGRPVPVAAVVAGLATWLALDAFLPARYHELADVFSFVPAVIYLTAASYELWNDRREALRGRYALLATLALHAVTLAGGVFDTLAGSLTRDALPALSTWFGLIGFESLFYSMASAVFMVLLTKERSERRYIVAAREDSLTGIANRGAVLEGGERLLRRCGLEGRSFSLIMFDLDHFKWINDTYGHATGDAVIRTFTDTTQSVLRPNNLFGRYGGEEFVIMLPGATIEAAYVIAERIRTGFAAMAVAVGGHELKSTVSAGIASATSSAMTLEAIMKIADTALYRAKELGRNRVERPAKAADTAPVSVIRIA